MYRKGNKMFIFAWIKRIFTDEVINNIAAGLESNGYDPALQARLDNLKKKETKETPDLNSMTKAKLVEWAKTELKVDLDSRKKKDFIIEQIKDHLNKEK